jgi:hypothetical protein
MPQNAPIIASYLTGWLLNHPSATVAQVQACFDLKTATDIADAKALGADSVVTFDGSGEGLMVKEKLMPAGPTCSWTGDLRILHPRITAAMHQRYTGKLHDAGLQAGTCIRPGPLERAGGITPGATWQRLAPQSYTDDLCQKIAYAETLGYTVIYIDSPYLSDGSRFDNAIRDIVTYFPRTVGIGPDGKPRGPFTIFLEGQAGPSGSQAWSDSLQFYGGYVELNPGDTTIDTTAYATYLTAGTGPHPYRVLRIRGLNPAAIQAVTACVARGDRLMVESPTQNPDLLKTCRDLMRAAGVTGF